MKSKILFSLLFCLSALCIACDKDDENTDMLTGTTWKRVVPIGSYVYQYEGYQFLPDANYMTWVEDENGCVVERIRYGTYTILGPSGFVLNTGYSTIKCSGGETAFSYIDSDGVKKTFLKQL